MADQMPWNQESVKDELPFSQFLEALTYIQEQVLPIEDDVNPNLHMVGCTANLCYLESKTGKAYVANLGDSRSMHGKLNTDTKDFRVT